MSYEQFIAEKLSRVPATGLTSVPELHASLFPHQRDLVSWALRRGRAAIFASTGLGKTATQLEWARHVPGPVLILAPLAVAAQTAIEGERLGIRVVRVREPHQVTEALVAEHVSNQGFVRETPRIFITNYDRLHKFASMPWGAVVLDESSVIKHHDAKTFAALTEAFKETPFKLCATATPSPNDYTELGTHAEFLGVCTRTEMLAEYFCHDGGDTSKWRLKGHARKLFWKWVASWGALVRLPSDLGYEDGGYALPPLDVHMHTIEAPPEAAKEQGLLFVEPAKTLTERRKARKGSMPQRVDEVVKQVRTCTCGNQNTTSGDGNAQLTIPSTGRNGTHNRNATPSTCGATTEPTRESSSSHASSEIESTLDGASFTPATQTIERKKTPRSQNTENDGRMCDSLSGSENTESPLTSIGRSSPSKTDDARSAAGKNRRASRASGSTLTTVTNPDVSEDCSAPNAIGASDTSQTAQSDSNARRHTSGCPAGEQWIIWCELNAEQDALFDQLQGEAVSIFGSLDVWKKESLHNVWLAGDARILISKSSIFGYGLNWQHCARIAFVGVSDSWEQYHQAIRRCWRFGQKRSVDVHVFASELEGDVVRNLQRKETDATKMALELSAETGETVRQEVYGATRETNTYAPARIDVPEWLRSETA